MDAAVTRREASATQRWRWRKKRQNGARQSTRQNFPPPNNPTQSDGPSSGGRSHEGRTRRRQAARKRYDGPQAQRLQKLFLRNRKACVREILEEGDGRRCKEPLDQLTDFFRDEYADVSIDESNPPDWLLDCLKGPDNPPAWNSASITGEEVRTQLKRMPVSSAPGPDRLPYKVWKAMDPDGELLAPIFEICRRERRIPGPWKVSTIVLIYKKGEESLPSNWRPISLQNAIFKLYAAVWARRLAEWARETGAISLSQKGFVPGEGCLEHSFLMRSLTEDARRKRKFLHLVFFDLKNAFGSIPHQLLWFSL